MVRSSFGRYGALMVTALLLGVPIAHADTSTAGNSTDRLLKIAIPGKPLRSFDIGWVDPIRARYYLADRSNASIDVIDTTEGSVVDQIGGFKGATGNNDTSGPDGVVVTFSGRELWAGDGDSSVKVVDLTSGTIAASISTGGKMRADELAYDPHSGVIVIANDADDPPFLTFISVAGRQVLGKLEFPNATDGLEQPAFDPATGLMYQAVPATKDHPGGVVAVIDDAHMRLVNSYPLDRCMPHGLAVGPAHQLLVGCSAPRHSIVLDELSGAVLADFTQTGGSDEVWFNPGEGRYYLAENSAQTLGIIDAMTNQFVENVESGLGAHSVSADSANNHIFVPIAGPDPACPTGCVAVFASVRGDGHGLPRQ